ncbi:hypothetical protein CFIO01_02305 [Colletotrichum fioriniae PJ7]|uniref:Uncharacterized protein n=1 Tax=Colletotrichum fioriniae PJ7 TaxID=1445577 RepID=A0A010S014_9PEZI|nr:hypothetical protein CFIO01_02305 [Colletotrichum fioriniae PJ7]
MRFLLRHETDRYVANGVSSGIAGATSDLVDELSNRLSIMSVSQAPESIRDRMTIVSTKTRPVDVESTLEIKTRAASRTLAMDEVFPQLWLSQTPLLVVAYHQQNRFSDVKLHNVKKDVCDWESANRENLRKLAFLIKRIRQVVEESNGRRALVKYNGGSAVQITSGLQSRALADDLYSIWDELKQNECTPIPNRSEHPGIEPMMPYGSMSNARQCERDPDNKPAIRQSTGAIGTFTNTEGSASHSEIIERGLRYGFRRIIRSMPTRLSDYHSLCETLRSRQVDVLAGRSLRDIMRDMRQGKDDWDPDERRTIAGFKSLARDSAFRLLYALVLDLPGVSDQNMAFNATMFVVSHRRIFKYKTRRMVREAFEERFLISRNQRDGLNKWPIGDSPCADLREDAEETTSEEELYYFDSDSS